MAFKHRQTVGAVSFFAVALVVGVVLGRSSWDGTIYLSKTSFLLNSRDPAAIRKDMGINKLDGDELITATQRRLVSAARVLLQNDDVGVELGHFVTRDDKGDRQLACDFYDRVCLKFEAEGFASGGDKPVLEVEAPCKTASDITRIEPIWIPVQRILAEKPSDSDLTYPDQDGVHFKFREMAGEWPAHWRLQAVRLYNEAEGGREVSLSGRDLRDLREKPIVLNWTNNNRMPTSAHGN